MAPELYDEAGEFAPTEASDIYALAMTYLAIVTLRPPFSEHTRDFGASCAPQKGVRPKKPKEMNALTGTQAGSLWVLLTLMWKHEPSERPDGMFVRNYLKDKLHSGGDGVDRKVVNVRTRTSSSAALSRRPQLSVGGATNIEKPSRRLDGTQRKFSETPDPDYDLI